MNFNILNYLYFFFLLLLNFQLQFEKTWFTKIELSVFAHELFLQMNASCKDLCICWGFDN